jgi:hypothetical protein
VRGWGDKLAERGIKIKPVFVFETGGTTGVSKGAMLSHRNVVSNLQQVAAWFTPMQDENAPHLMVTPLPLYHIYGLNVALNPIFTLGATLVLMPRFNVPNLCNLITEEGVTMMPLVPPAMNALCQAVDPGESGEIRRQEVRRSALRADLGDDLLAASLIAPVHENAPPVFGELLRDESTDAVCRARHQRGFAVHGFHVGPPSVLPTCLHPKGVDAMGGMWNSSPRDHPSPVWVLDKGASSTIGVIGSDWMVPITEESE